MKKIMKNLVKVIAIVTVIIIVMTTLVTCQAVKSFDKQPEDHVKVHFMYEGEEIDPESERGKELIMEIYTRCYYEQFGKIPVFED